MRTITYVNLKRNPCGESGFLKMLKLLKNAEDKEPPGGVCSAENSVSIYFRKYLQKKSTK